MTDEPAPPGPDQPSATGAPRGGPVVHIEDELKRSYLDYAMSVIVARALPDARDGLKPVHRRILYSMYENNQTPDRPYVKSARVVGDVMGKYHPHGDQAIYDALVRMAQDFSMGLMLIDGQGNFGSVDNDPPAAMRYTEARLSKAALPILEDLGDNTVEFQPNYDGKEDEPTVLPARYPNLLVNGGSGIAVGMATSIPPHNLGEVVDATLAMIDNPDITDLELLEIVPGPDFPTGGEIIGRAGARHALATGRGSVVVRGGVEIRELRKDRDAIIISSIPYAVNKASMVEKISELVREKRVEGISEIRDESNRQGVRIVIELKRDATPDVVLNQLYRYSPLQTSISFNMLALNAGRPQQMTLRTILESFISFREDVIARRAKHRLSKARDRGHVLVGLAVAVANIDDVIRIIRESPDPAAARAGLMSRDWDAKNIAPLISLIADPRSMLSDDGTIRLTDEQARAILDLRLQRLTGLGREELDEEGVKLAETIRDLLDLLSSRARIRGVVKDELAEVRARFAAPRRTIFVDADVDIEDEALIPRDDMVVTVTHGGYVKRTSLSAYRTQHRGGKGKSGMATKDEDYVTRLFVASTHAPVLFFSSTGMVYKEKVWRLPEGAPTARGKALINMLPLEKGETITSVMALPEDPAEWAALDVMFATRSGYVRRNKLSDFVNVNRSGKIAMKPDDGDSIVGVRMCTPTDDVLLTTAKAMCIRFAVDEVRVFAGRTSTGVRGIALGEDDEVIGMSILRGVEATPAERAAYLRHAVAMRRAIGEEPGEPVDAESAEADESVESIGPERIAVLGAREQFVLTVTDRGFGKRTSAYEYRSTGRGGKGLVAHKLADPAARVAASFPVEETDEVMLVTDGSQVIRTPCDQIRIAGRGTQGVTVIRVAAGERVVAVEHLEDLSGERTPGRD